MKKLFCQCGNQVFFENKHCVSCNAKLGFDPISMQILTLAETEDGLYKSDNHGHFHYCDNEVNHQVCNWLRPSDSTHPLCVACQFNRTVPNQSLPGNQRRWQLLEEAKKRLFFTLLQLKLPLVNGWQDPDNGLLLDFIDDARSQPIYSETFVNTGYLGGIITINALEADDIARVSAQSEMNESYRTILGHLRHESGHYYWARLNPDEEMKEAFYALFGNESEEYNKALERYYANGPISGWGDHYISAYASAHPSEDWAETWGHYLHIYDALETAAAHGVVDCEPISMDMTTRIHVWRKLSITLNELNRSIGRADAYPFVINSQVEQKLGFVNKVIARLQTLC